MDLAVIGLGLMGGALARHLLDDGHNVIGCDPEPERRAEHRTGGGSTAAGPAEAAAATEAVILSLPDSTIALDVCAELPDVSPRMAPGDARPLVVDTTTGDPAHSVQAAAGLAVRGWAYVDATISGNAAQAGSRDIIFMVGGRDADVARARPILTALAREVHHLGPVGAGARAKLVVNHLLAVNRAALAEALTVAERSGIDLPTMLEVLRASAAHSKAVDLWGQRMVDGHHHDPASRIRQGHKDARLMVANAEELGASHHLVQEVLSILTEAAEGGFGDADQSAVIEVLRRRAGIGRIGQ